jgi:DNA-binding GntR family transcriptional regulator
MIIEDRLPRETAREYALRQLKENIISLQLEPGSMVSENEIAAQLGISRTPVREALIELSRVNIVEILPQKGSRIMLIDYALVEESRFLRLVLEREVAKVLCTMEEIPDLSFLEEIIRLQSFYIEHSNPEKLLELDNQFHALLFLLANKVQCYGWMIEGLTIHFDRVRAMSLNAIKDIKIVSDHQAIAEAIKQRDAELAGQLMEKHLSRYKIDESAIREKYPTYFR